MTLLSVNINKIATLRNARGHDNPNLISYCQMILDVGIEGITVHPRPDERHITRKDVQDICNFLKNNNSAVEFNIEGYPSTEFLELIHKIKPAQCTLVPDAPDTITSNAGWDLYKNQEYLTLVCTDLKRSGIRSSLFIEPSKMKNQDYEALKIIGCDRVELYTEKYATDFATPSQEQTVELYKNCALRVNELGIHLNAGHDLDQKNLKALIDAIPTIKEVSIGHALICESLIDGFLPTLAIYKKILGYK